MIVRKAVLIDSKSVSSCLFLAMEEIIYKLIGESSFEKAFAFMRHLVGTEGNQYSWQNCWVVENDGKVVAAVNVYDGAQLQTLRKPVIEYLQSRFNRNVLPEDETGAGEFYIDSLGVQPQHRSKGIATTLLKFLIDDYVISRGLALGLLVDQDNLDAMRLYQRLGFKSVGRKALLGKDLEHLQLSR